MFPLKNTEAYIHANGFRSTLGKELADRDAEINELGSEIQALTNKLTDEAETRAALGAHNLLLNYGTTQVINDVSFTVNSDKSITVVADGTQAQDVTFRLSTIAGGTYTPVESGKTYIISGLPSGSSTTTYYYEGGFYKGSTWVATPKITSDYTIAVGPELDIDRIAIAIVVKSGTTINKTFYPMLRLATDADPTYQPYAKTNAELTQNFTTLLKVNVQALEEQTIVSEASYQWNVTPTAIEGYTPVGVVGFYIGTNSTKMSVFVFRLFGTNIHFGLKNIETNSVTITPTVNVLYVKNGSV